ncbi:RHS repeat domain-containing protein [Cysteiniphilum halobium]|uniref:RHS repeat domain-containing protein n=1 Tax=Cysteiniphilum halobium TaxID=2219059 RepID=UPI003F84CFFF
MFINKSKLCIGMGMSCLLITQSMAYSLDSSKAMDKQSNQNVNHQRVLVSSAIHYNANGNISMDNQGASFSYNVANALTQVSLTAGAKESDYYYANGLRAVAQSNTQVLVHYYSRHNELLNSSDGAQQSSAYLIANNVAVRSVNGNATVLLHNRHGSVIAQLGDKSQFYQYSVYGVQKTEDRGRKTDSGTLDLAMNPLRYSSYMFDPLTGLYYLKARDYDPHLRSFIQADSYAFNNYGLINGYFYGNNNPVMGIDPSGHVSEVLTKSEPIVERRIAVDLDETLLVANDKTEAEYYLNYYKLYDGLKSRVVDFKKSAEQAYAKYQKSSEKLNQLLAKGKENGFTASKFVEFASEDSSGKMEIFLNEDRVKMLAQIQKENKDLKIDVITMGLYTKESVTEILEKYEVTVSEFYNRADMTHILGRTPEYKGNFINLLGEESIGDTSRRYLLIDDRQGNFIGMKQQHQQFYTTMDVAWTKEDIAQRVEKLLQ